MIFKLNSIIIYGLLSFFLSLMLYPLYIVLLKKCKAGKTIRDDSVTWDKASVFKQLHQHKAWTPTMWWWLILIVLLGMVLLSILIQHLGWTNHSLFSRQETYIILFAVFSMGTLWLIDDYLNIKATSGIKWLTAHIKFVWMFGFSWFISYWFYYKLGIDTFNLRPFALSVDLGIWSAVFTFFFTVAIVNAINITDGLDGLVWWLMLIILWVLAIMTFVTQRYLATTIIAIIVWCTIAFLWFNINPAKIFMGDSGSLAFGWLVASLVYLLNMRFGVLIPFILLFMLFWVEFGSSFLQIARKKIFKKKLFTIAPFHHALEHSGQKESTIVMKFRVIQWILATIAMLGIFYQMQV